MERRTKLTRDDLRNMEMGEQRTFHLIDAAALDCAAVSAVQVGRLEGCKFACSRDYAELSITVEKQPLPL